RVRMLDIRRAPHHRYPRPGRQRAWGKSGLDDVGGYAAAVHTASVDDERGVAGGDLVVGRGRGGHPGDGVVGGPGRGRGGGGGGREVSSGRSGHERIRGARGTCGSWYETAAPRRRSAWMTSKAGLSRGSSMSFL